jgi:DNA modification methylase
MTTTLAGQHTSVQETLAEVVERHLPGIRTSDAFLKTWIPSASRDQITIAKIHAAVHELPTRHTLVHDDARSLDMISENSVHLIVTSPPYWTLKEYNRIDGQLGYIDDYEHFLAELGKVWAECLRVLVPGGRLVVVVGDVCLSRRRYGRHVVFPLHASIQEQCRKLGFDNLSPIIWYKIANAQFEVQNGSSFLGKPYEPNAVLKNDIEFILMQRKPGGYRTPTPEMRILSTIGELEHKEWFQQIWQIPGASTRGHPAPYPVEVAERLIRMFSFVGDTVLDPFMGTASTSVAAARWGRQSIGYEIDAQYFALAEKRLVDASMDLFSPVSVATLTQQPRPARNTGRRKKPAGSECPENGANYEAPP